MHGPAANRILPRDNDLKETNAVMMARMWIRIGLLLALVPQPGAVHTAPQIVLTGAGRGVIVFRHQASG
jgi:hypothetical protein